MRFPEVIKELCLEFQRTKDPSVYLRILQRLEFEVKFYIRRFSKKFNFKYYDMEDFISSGILGFTEFIYRVTPEMPLNHLEGFLQNHINRSMIRYVRGNLPLWFTNDMAESYGDKFPIKDKGLEILEIMDEFNSVDKYANQEERDSIYRHYIDGVAQSDCIEDSVGLFACKKFYHRKSKCFNKLIVKKFENRLNNLLATAYSE